MKCSWLLPVVFAVFLCCGCDGVFVDDLEEQTVDSLNDRAHDFRYVSLDSCYECSSAAYELASNYVDGQHLALLNKAFVEYMRLNLAEAIGLCQSVLDESDNELICLIANVHLMKISALTSANKDFFYYRNSALSNMKRIGSDEMGMTDRQRLHWRLALSEFHIVSAEYYYGLRQEAEALDEIAELEDGAVAMTADSVQMARLILLKSINDIFVGDDDNNAKFRNVVRAYRIGREKNSLYLCAKSLQMMAYELVRTDSLAAYRVENIKGLLDKRAVANDSLALALSQEALMMAREYGSEYLESFSYLSLSDYYFYNGNYRSALEYAEMALNLINEYQRKFSGCEEGLCAYSDVSDSMSTEMVWINNPEVITLPGWIADVRERLSLIYSALGDKTGADYNRNIYLDILDATRQDMRMEQRLDSLAEEEAQLDWALVVCGIAILLLLVAFALFLKWQKHNSAVYNRKLLEVVDDCKDFLSLSLSSSAANSREVRDRLAKVKDVELRSVIEVFTDWVDHNTSIAKEFEDKCKDIENERYMYDRRIEEKKRDNIYKLICMSIINGIAPYLDRAIKEVEKLKKKVNGGEPVGDCQYELEYLSELIDKINDYNDVVSRWVMMRHGIVNLNVESFALQSMFDVLGKNKSLFEAKGVALEIGNTSLVVKADKALTFFMINTLLDNARKYTESGGTVWLGAEATEDNGVRVFIKDTGRGLSESDVNKILYEKVYDAALIGNPDGDNSLKSSKGFGFGLMSCKGIIDKYRKTSPFFSVCRFDLTSKLGEGSTFSFTLPKGVLRSFKMVLLIIAVSFSIISCNNGGHHVLLEGIEESLPVVDSVASDSLLAEASYYADKAYYSNVQGDYAVTLNYVDSAICRLNQYHLETSVSSDSMVLYGTMDIPEVGMLERGDVTDYHIILDIRNEAAIASLALNRWNVYRYNNEAYTRLYKLMAQDNSLEGYCDAMEKTNANKQTLLIFMLIVVLMTLVLIFLLYYKNSFLPTLNMKQLLWMNRKLYGEESGVYKMLNADGEWSLQENVNDLLEHYQNYVDTLYESVSEIKYSDGMALLVLRYDGEKPVMVHTEGCPELEYINGQMHYVARVGDIITGKNGKIRVYPLSVDDKRQLIGALAVAFHSSSYSSVDDIVFRLVVQFTALNIYYSDMMMERRMQGVEILEDKRRKLVYEENLIHVQNQILDNCMSTIKHETMYYPNRIKQIADRMKCEGKCSADEVGKMEELVVYYKEIYTVLQCYASRQFGVAMFKRRKISISAIADYIWVSYERLCQKHGAHFKLDLGRYSDLSFVGDEQLVQYLFYTLLQMAFEDKREGRVMVSFEMSDGFVNFAFIDNRGEYTSELLNSYFYPDTLASDDDVSVSKTKHMLVCKQIIREHDEHSGRRGCRIFATPNPDSNGYRVVFTLPA